MSYSTPFELYDTQVHQNQNHLAPKAANAQIHMQSPSPVSRMSLPRTSQPCITTPANITSRHQTSYTQLHEHPLQETNHTLHQQTSSSTTEQNYVAAPVARLEKVDGAIHPLTTPSATSTINIAHHQSYYKLQHESHINTPSISKSPYLLLSKTPTNPSFSSPPSNTHFASSLHLYNKPDYHSPSSSSPLTSRFLSEFTPNHTLPPSSKLLPPPLHDVF